MQSFVSFSSWHAVVSHAVNREPLYYHAPLDTTPRRISFVQCFKNGKLRLRSPETNVAFTADASHLERFRCPAPDYAAAFKAYCDGEPGGTHTTTCYGILPSREAFDAAFDAYTDDDGLFEFGNDPYVGTDRLNASQLWRELNAQHATWERGEHAPKCPGDGSCPGDGCPSEDAGSWCSDVLGCLGFEWI